MLIRDVMTPAPLTVSSGTSVHDAAGLLTRYGFAVLPVVASRALVGVVTVSDVLRARDACPGSPVRVGEVMTRTADVVHADTDIAEVAVLMVDRGLRSLPVVADDQLVGIVTRLDVTRVLARSDADLRAAVERTLDAYAGWSRWTVHAREGEVALCDDFDDPVEQHLATVIAAAVLGTVHVDTHHRADCPHERRDLRPPGHAGGPGTRWGQDSAPGSRRHTSWATAPAPGRAR
ncbi:CBS domain-containing protein [Actinomycetospora sp. NBC_00405]|uniref:CBS domain-containing protein n=1 Tax=Actinomycetospora sp. NBC_00405 TaxID=2975952 RepID=UPI002E200F83